MLNALIKFTGLALAADPATSPTTAPATQPATQADKAQELTSQVVTLFGPTFTRTAWWEWVLMLAAIFLGLVAGKIVKHMLTSLAGRMEKRTWPVRAMVLRHTAGPASLALLTFGVGVGIQWPYIRPEVLAFALKIIGFLYIIAIGWFLYNAVELIDLALRRIAARTSTRIDDTVVTLLRKALRIFLLIMMGLFVAENIFGADITAWLAGLGIAGLAVSLAAQDSVKNVFGSITILMEHPFGIGDRIVFGPFDGTVESIGFRSTRIRTITGSLVTVPNMRFTDGTVENITARAYMSRTFNLTIPVTTPPDRVEQAVRMIEKILADPDVSKPLDLPERPPRVYFNQFNPDSLNINVSYWYRINVDGQDGWTFQSHAQDLNLRLMRELSEAGIDLSIPTYAVAGSIDTGRQQFVRAKPA